MIDNPRQWPLHPFLPVRRGDGFDAMLTLYNERAQQIAFHDDLPKSRDARLEVELPADGVYFLVLIDAHDRGGPTHPYRLVVYKK